MLENFSVQEIFNYGIVAAGGLAIGVKKLLAINAETNVQIARSDSQEDVIKILTDQVNRFAETEKSLREEFTKLRVSFTDQTIELRLLKTENSELRDAVTDQTNELKLLKTENSELRAEVSRLREELGNVIHPKKS